MGGKGTDGQSGTANTTNKLGKSEVAEGLHRDSGSQELAELPRQSPLFHASNADRYSRQELIKLYEAEQNCRLIVMVDAVFNYSIPFFE